MSAAPAGATGYSLPETLTPNGNAELKTTFGYDCCRMRRVSFIVRLPNLGWSHDSSRPSCPETFHRRDPILPQLQCGDPRFDVLDLDGLGSVIED